MNASPAKDLVKDLPVPVEDLERLFRAVGDFVDGGFRVPHGLFRAYLDVAYTPWGQRDYLPRQRAPRENT